MTYEEAHEHLIIKGDDLYWKAPRGRRNINQPAGYICKSNGYRAFWLDNKKYYAHRIVFLMTHGYVPKIIDHIDGNRSNNSPENLREASQSQNNINRKRPAKTNSTGYTGVCYNNKLGRYVAYINVNKRRKQIGCYKTVEAAAAARRDAEIKYYGEYAPNAK